MSEWGMTSLGEVAETLLGKTLPRGSGRVEGGSRYLRNVNVQWHRIDTDDLNTMVFSAKEQSQYELRVGDLLVCEGGEVGRLAVVQADMPGIYFQNALHRVRVRDHSITMPAFLALTLEHLVRSGGLAGLVSQVTIAHLNQRKLRSLPIPLPPLPEQRRIVDVMAAVDAQISALVDELEAAERATVSLRMETFGALDVVSIPAGQKFDMLLGRQKSARQSVGEHVLPYLRAANITNTGLKLDDVQMMNFEPAEQEKYGLRVGDVVLVEGGSIGQAARWNADIDGVVGFDKHVIRFRARGGVSIPEYALQWIRWAHETGAFAEQATGITIKALGFGRASAMPVPDLSVEEQEVLTAPLAAAETASAELRDELVALRSFRSTLLSALLNQEIEIPESYDRLLEAVTMGAD